ncbi:MAG TPA: 1-acyl-sn-glycerol-3-phosphate acyltransferase [Baekduia sp.]|uniref:1-acyl-sn-glycerol-3-phosphate acyltransferase n=1 Tax=Baekduia sp. TaxID=2600305 RepID=UPI002C7E55A7|nr:1-acyl-sn-glycerol-3-phosphate acyltransferase [Baekduia sp.]HMJ34424.1 1-acyl-sn-glycerol-3-phosphate acyltransferase [Baekduia sp.]
MGPLLPDSGPRGPRIARRAKGIAVEAGAFAVVTLTLPLLLAAAATVDLVLWVLRRKPWVGVRLVAMLWWFLFGELRGVAGLGLIGLASLGRDTRTRRFRVYRLRQLWAAGHLSGVRRLFGLTFDVRGLDDVAPGPVLILMRHASIIDNTLPDALIGKAHDMGLRFVIKRELQMLPTIDIGGRWVPTHFVRRGSGDTVGELEDLRKLAIDLDPHEGVLIYPEGTRFTPAKLAQAIEAIAERQPALAQRARGLRHVLPPRLGGPLALLEAGRGTDVVFCAHVGLDGFERISDIWRGGLVGGTVCAQFWRFDAAEVPAEREALVAWLYDRWQQVDDWVGAHKD